jgi:hypothetical protein
MPIFQFKYRISKDYPRILDVAHDTAQKKDEEAVF